MKRKEIKYSKYFTRFKWVLGNYCQQYDIIKQTPFPPVNPMGVVTLQCGLEHFKPITQVYLLEAGVVTESKNSLLGESFA